MKVLVTGATGFIGYHVISELKKRNVDIYATAIESIDQLKHIDLFDGVNYLPLDLNNYSGNLFDYFHKPDILIHLAWEGLPNYNKLIHLDKNLITSYKFIKNLVANGLKDVNIIGTCFEYGILNGCLSEDLLVRPENAYALAKDTLRKFIEEINKNLVFEFKWIRLFYMYGKGQNPNSILSLLQRSIDNGEKIFNMSGGEQLRDYLPVEKVAFNIVEISLQKKINGIINCCSGTPTSIRNLVEGYLRDTNQQIDLNMGYYHYQDHEPMAFWGDNTKLLKIINNYK
jgi:nucleoside-diphosphate-sugar epimerase